MALPASVGEIDAVILSLAREQWLKVARIVVQAQDTFGDLAEQDLERVAERIEALVDAGKLEAQGNLKRWRYSEVRLAS